MCRDPSHVITMRRDPDPDEGEVFFDISIIFVAFKLNYNTQERFITRSD